jgi:hypothetical protein
MLLRCALVLTAWAERDAERAENGRLIEERDQLAGQNDRLRHLRSSGSGAGAGTADRRRPADRAAGRPCRGGEIRRPPSGAHFLIEERCRYVRQADCWDQQRRVGQAPQRADTSGAAWQARQAYFGRRVNEHPVLRRNDVEPLRAILADYMHRPATTRAGGVFRRDDDLDPWQVDLEQAIAANEAEQENADPALRKALSDKLQRMQFGRRSEELNPARNAAKLRNGLGFTNGCYDLLLTPPHRFVQAQARTFARVGLLPLCLQSLVKFLRGDDCRAGLANDNAGCSIGKAHRFADRQPCAVPRAESAITVSPAPDTSKTSCAAVFKCNGFLPRSKYDMPRSERVSRMAELVLAIAANAAVSASSSVSQGMPVASVNSRCPEKVGQHGSGLVAADYADPSNFATEGSEVGADIRGAAQQGALCFVKQHRHRRFRRQPLDRPQEISVEHHIPDHHDTAAGEVEMVHMPPKS